jgi:hypothetical protein
VAIPGCLDHLILGASDLAGGIEFVERHTGVRAALGGVHPGRGTHNALLSLGPRCYLEILAPDPNQPTLAWFRNLQQLTEPRLVGWMVRPGDLVALAEGLRQSGIACEPPRESSRQRPDGRTLRWKLLRLASEPPGSQPAEMEGLLPFCIEWSADSPHPADDAPLVCTSLSSRYRVRIPTNSSARWTSSALICRLPAATTRTSAPASPVIGAWRI